MASTPENTHRVSVTLTFCPDEADRPDIVMHRILTSVINANLSPLESISAHVIDPADDGE